MKEILKTIHLTKKYHTPSKEVLALKDISFSINEGEIVSIVGPSGCGKSTILSILANLEKPSDGIIKVHNNKKIAYMMQDDALLPFRTVLENCYIGLELEKDLSEDKKKYINKLIYAYGLNDFINQYPNSLSGGMRQRVALIRTLATNPDILLLDEAFSALDYQNRLIISEDIYKTIKQEKKTVIMVTHDIGEAISMSDRVIVLSNRPSVIKKEYSIHLDNPTTPIKNRTDNKYSYYFNKIWGDLNE